MEKNFSEGKYNKILIDGNKAFSTYTGTGENSDGK